MSGGKKPAPKQDKKDVITILLVDDIPETRENIKKLLAFEPDFKVVGTAGTGREGVELAKKETPDIIIMDINMPDMDGLQATNLITKQVPTAAVIIMSVQNDPDYMRRAMLAGARDFLSKPINMDEIYNTIRTVYKNHEPIRKQYEALESGMLDSLRALSDESTLEGDRAGHVITLYSPSGGAGTTTLATSLASGLMKENIKVLLIDADLQFADVGTFLNLQSQTTIVEVVEDVADLDVDLFENVVTTHDSGLKVLIGPPRPEFADQVTANPENVATIIEKIRNQYDFIIIDTSNRLDETLLNIFERSSKIILVGTPTLVSVKNMRLVLDLFDQIGYDPNKTWIALNHVWEDNKGKSATITPEKVESYLKRPVIARIPKVDERVLLSAINRGVPVIASDRRQDRPPIKQLVELSNYIFEQFMADEEEEQDKNDTPKKRGGIASFLGR
ncbi:MAG: hypothetical protein CUN56_07425 [Phototrophicales bacterium]|nr:MAG: hypothetical protein CUN56_07425 [Phototrophicales bacterium]RMG76071.1 MAG: response regulator [Chloroflexota bacterium]